MRVAKLYNPIVCLTLLGLIIILLLSASSAQLGQAQAQIDQWITYDAPQQSDATFQYGIGDWQHVQVAEAYNGTLSYTEVTGGNVDIAFTGTGIELIYAQTIGGSTFKMHLFDSTGNEIPGTLRLTDSNASAYSYGHIVRYDQLPEGSYTLAVVNGPGALAVDGVGVQLLVDSWTLAFDDHFENGVLRIKR
jgi:hypothetical protein